MTWRDLSWTSQATEDTRVGTDTHGRKTSRSSTTTSISTTAKNVLTSKPPPSDEPGNAREESLPRRKDNSGGSSIQVSDKTSQSSTTTGISITTSNSAASNNQISKSKNTDSEEGKSSSQSVSPSIKKPSNTEKSPLGLKTNSSTTQQVTLVPQMASTPASPATQPREVSGPSHQVHCHRHAAGYMHCGVNSDQQDGMLVGLVGGYAALALVVAISSISVWASKYLPFLLKMWWIKALSCEQTYDVNT